MVKTTPANNIYLFLTSNDPKLWAVAEAQIRRENKKHLKSICKKLQSYSNVPKSAKYLKIIELLHKRCE